MYKTIIVYDNGNILESEVENLKQLLHYIKVCENAYGNEIISIEYYREEKERDLY